MKKSEIKKLNNKTQADLKKALYEAKEDLRTLRFDLSAGKVKNIERARNARRKIARILTFLKEKEKEESQVKQKK